MWKVTPLPLVVIRSIESLRVKHTTSLIHEIIKILLLLENK